MNYNLVKFGEISLVFVVVVEFMVAESHELKSVTWKDYIFNVLMFIAHFKCVFQNYMKVILVHFVVKWVLVLLF